MSKASSHCFALSILWLLVVIATPLSEALSSAVLDTARIARMQNKEEKRPQVFFSHVHLYVDELNDLKVYKDLEDRLNSFVKDCDAPLGSDISTQRKLWEQVQPDHLQEPSAFVPQNRDLVQQLLSGFGFRVTGARYNPAAATRSVLVTSQDPSGVQFLLTAKEDPKAPESQKHDCYHHFDAGKPFFGHCINAWAKAAFCLYCKGRINSYLS